MQDEVCYVNGKPFQIVRTSGEHIRHPEINEIKIVPLADGKQRGAHFFLVNDNPVHAHCDHYDNKREISNTVVNPVTYVISGTEMKIPVSIEPVPVNASGNVNVVLAPIDSLHYINYAQTSGSIKIMANCSGYIACAFVPKS